MKKTWVRGAAAAAAGVLLAFVTACGSTSGGAAGGSGETAPEVVSAAQAALDVAAAGAFRTVPTEGPAAQTGKNVWAVACTMAAPGCRTPVEGFAEAAEVLGWRVTMADGKADPATYNSIVKQAIAAKADGIFLFSIDCSLVRNSLGEARAAGIPVVSAYAYDCNEGGQTGEQMFAQGTEFYGGSIQDFYHVGGVMHADYVIAKTEGKGKVVYVSADTFQIAKDMRAGFTERMAECGGCEVVETIFSPTGENANGVLAQKIETAFQKHPDADTLVVWADSKTIAIAQTIKKLKQQRPGLIAVGAEGLHENIPLIAQGVQDVAFAVPMEWLGWGAADALNRAFTGVTPDSMPDTGIGRQMLTEDRGLNPDGKTWTPAVDFRAAYTKLWTGR